MANYQYDEGGNMAALFVLTFLSIILIPLTYSLLPSASKSPELDGCQCSPCLDRRERIRKRKQRSLLNPQLGPRDAFVVVGWGVFAFLAYKVATTRIDSKIYDPFEILGIRAGTPEKEIQSHYKKLSRKFHPDKVKLAVNQTLESVNEYFVEITKAYKSLTDETIRKNWELYGHPDGRQEVSMGIAIPKWVIEGKNKIWVLLAYCAVIGGLLPVIVGRWWFGKKIKTKDGVYTKTADVFFKALKEDSSMEAMVEKLGEVLEWESPNTPVSPELESKVRARLGESYRGTNAATLLYAHILRIPIDDVTLRKAQEQVLVRTPVLLTSLLNIVLSRNWLQTALTVMRLHAYLAQALPPSQTVSEELKLAQLPGCNADEVASLISKVDDAPMLAFIRKLESNADARVDDVKKAAEKWGKFELVEASFKVLGERIMTPSSIVQLLIKARINPTNTIPPDSSDDVDEVKRAVKLNEEKDYEFLANGKGDSEESDGNKGLGFAHAPYWPEARKPSWWILLADGKSNRIIVPPMKISDVPFSDPSKDRNFRAYKLQFQAPQTVGMYTWKLFAISDTFVGEDIIRDLVLKLDDPSLLNADERGMDDEISDPEEDSLAGQMAAMRGGSVKKARAPDSDDESGTDDESSGGSDSSSDSD